MGRRKDDRFDNLHRDNSDPSRPQAKAEADRRRASNPWVERRMSNESGRPDRPLQQ